MKKDIVFGVIITFIAILLLQLDSSSKISQFQQWKNKYGVQWQPEEEAYRQYIFQKNVADIEKHNSDSTQTYRKGINQFTVFTQQEFMAMFLRTLSLTDTPMVNYNQQPTIPADIQDIDWTTKGIVSPVKDQGQCNAGYIFSAVGTFQSYLALKNENVFLVNLSEQQMLDCGVLREGYGCYSGQPQTIFTYMLANGITISQKYLWKGYQQKCRKKGGQYKPKSIATSYGCFDLAVNIQNQPISVSVDAINWKDYQGGLFTDCYYVPNHNVILVGIFEGSWKAKNSWGDSWGQQGYIRFKKGSTCGICTSPAFYLK